MFTELALGAGTMHEPASRDDQVEAPEWPTTLVLDELWLRARRRLIDGLHGHGLWWRSPEFEHRRRAGRELGRALRVRILDPVLTAEDLRYLRREAAFAGPPGWMNSRLPSMLSFGYDIGAGLNGHTCDPQVREEAGRICALFNCGIALLDALCDRIASGSAELFQILDLEVVAGAMRDASSLEHLETRAQFVALPEARIVGRVAAGFYRTLWKTAGARGRSGTWQQLGNLLVRAYRAEALAAGGSASGVSQEILEAAAVAKSVLPFEVMAGVCEACEPARRAGDAVARTERARQIGEVFGLVDDLMDLVHDTEGAAVNSIALRACADATSAPGVVARRLLDSGDLDNAAAKVTAGLCALVTELRDSGNDDFADALIVDVQNWVIGDRGDARGARRRAEMRARSHEPEG